MGNPDSEAGSAGWVVAEKEFNPLHLGKYESILCLGNGYLGIRSATEERYAGETRCTFVAGTFDRFHESEVTELPNCADVFALDMEINGVRFSLETGTNSGYVRSLNLETGELTRSYIWEAPKTGRVAFEFRRFVSLADLHLIAQKITITPLDDDLAVRMDSGIDGQITNSGSQHFSEGEKRLYAGEYLQAVQTTVQSGIDFVCSLVHKAQAEGRGGVSSMIAMDRRKIFLKYDIELHRGESFHMEKFATIHTSRDRRSDGAPNSLKQLKDSSWRNLAEVSAKGYDVLLAQSARAWRETVWDKADIAIECEDASDLLAVRFAQYHLRIMTPAHDNRMNIGAKGLSGEGYKGHTFWDTEIFMLPYFTWTMPETARSLLEYRFLSLPGARRKALENGYAGAMFPWESAWLEDGETTPVWGAADVVTGKAMKIWTGFIEQHITADVAFGACFYAQACCDGDFMLRCGYEIVFECATFWASRLEWCEEKQRFHINGVIGPDEYKEHVDNNAFTNYMAHWTISKAIDFYTRVKNEHPEVFGSLNARLGLDAAYAVWMDRIGKIYLPQPTDAGVLPQDDTYLSKPCIDLDKYKNQPHVGSIYRDYNNEQITGMQVSKQADVLLLLLLQEQLFPHEIKLACWNYYEPRTLHDSSLSLSTHSILANDIGNRALAYSLFKRVISIDLGPDMKSSDSGIHAAAMGGIWQCVVYGFGGVRMMGGRLRISPRLPGSWSRLSFPISWHGNRLHINITKDTLMIFNETCSNEEIEVEIYDKTYILTDRLEIAIPPED